MASDAIIDGAKGAGAGLAGSLFLGPTFGPLAAGYAADSFMDGSTAYTEMGVAISAASLLMGGMGAGTSGGRSRM